MNALPWWITWFDGRALLLILIIAGLWFHYYLAGDDNEK